MTAIRCSHLLHDDALQRNFCQSCGPAPNYDMQKILSTRSPQEASKMSGFVNVILLPIRYP